MRQHKFRVWDKTQKKWLGVNLHMSVVDGLLWWQFGYECEILSAEETKNIELLEYIGRNDKNGKMICEGDILRDCYYSSDEEDWHYLGPSGKGIVIWNDDHTGFQIETNRWNKEKISKALPEHTLHQIVSEWVEIIGNKYDNPKLLKEANSKK